MQVLQKHHHGNLGQELHCGIATDLARHLFKSADPPYGKNTFFAIVEALVFI